MHPLYNVILMSKRYFSQSAFAQPIWLAGFSSLFELGVFFFFLKYIYLSFTQIHVVFYFNYIIYFGLLIFCCHNVANLYSLFTASVYTYSLYLNCHFNHFNILFPNKTIY